MTMEAPVENVDGTIVEKHSHSWSHEVRHEINWSYALLALVALVVVYVFVVDRDGADQDDRDEQGGWP